MANVETQRRVKSNKSRQPQGALAPRLAKLSESDMSDLLHALMEMRSGNFDVRLPASRAGLAGRIAEVFNDICASNHRIAEQLETVGTQVGKEGRTRQRVKFGPGRGAWSEMESSVNTLIEDLLWPTVEVTRAVAAVAQGNLIHTVRLDVEGRPLKASFFALPPSSTR